MGDIKIHIIYLLVLLTFFSACSIKEEVPGEPVTIGETKVRFELFTKAGTYGLPVSRAGENESVVDQQPWVLVFLGTGGTARSKRLVLWRQFRLSYIMVKHMFIWKNKREIVNY